MMLTSGKSILKTLVSFMQPNTLTSVDLKCILIKSTNSTIKTKHIGLETPTQNKQGHVTTQTVS